MITSTINSLDLVAEGAMAQDSPLVGFLKWAGGIVGAVVSGVLILHFTQKPVPPPPPAPIVVAGRVISADRLLPSVAVTLTAGSYSGQQTTDSEGRYGFSVPDVDANTMANLKIEAGGYTPNPYNVVEPLGQLSASDGDRLLEAAATPAPPAPNPAGGAGPHAGKPPAAATFMPPQDKPHVPLPAYVRRQDLAKLTPR